MFQNSSTAGSPLGSTGCQSPGSNAHQQAQAQQVQQAQQQAQSNQPVVQEVQQRLIIQEGMIHPGFHPVIHQPRSAAFPGLPPPNFATPVSQSQEDQKPGINHLLQKLG